MYFAKLLSFNFMSNFCYQYTVGMFFTAIGIYASVVSLQFAYLDRAVFVVLHHNKMLFYLFAFFMAANNGSKIGEISSDPKMDK